VPIPAIAPGSLLDSPLANTLITSTNQTISSSANPVGIASALSDSASYYSPPDPLTQDLIALLKTLAYGDVAGAKTDLARYKADLQAALAGPTANGPAEVVTFLNQDPTSQKTTSTQAETLVAKISDSLSSGSAQSALHDLAGYLVQNGQATGGLLDTFG
jgi:hypothetical protein